MCASAHTNPWLHLLVSQYSVNTATLGQRVACIDTAYRIGAELFCPAWRSCAKIAQQAAKIAAEDCMPLSVGILNKTRPVDGLGKRDKLQRRGEVRRPQTAIWTEAVCDGADGMMRSSMRIVVRRFASGVEPGQLYVDVG